MKISGYEKIHIAFRCCMIYLHSSDPALFRGGGVNFKYLPWRGRESKILKKGGGSMVQGQIFLKGRGGAGTFSV